MNSTSNQPPDKDWLLSKSPCSNGLQFAQSLNFNFAEIYEKCERGDWLIWLLRKSNNLTKKQSVKIAIVCAEHILEKFEKKYPEDKRPRNAIQAAKNWIDNPTEKNRLAANAAYAAYAANAAYAAYAANAAYAAYAADAAYAAADAADAAAYAAYAADAAADAAAYAAAYAAANAAANAANAERFYQANEIRRIVPNPFLKFNP